MARTQPSEARVLLDEFFPDIGQVEPARRSETGSWGFDARPEFQVLFDRVNELAEEQLPQDKRRRVQFDYALSAIANVLRGHSRIVGGGDSFDGVHPLLLIRESLLECRDDPPATQSGANAGGSGVAADRQKVLVV